MYYSIDTFVDSFLRKWSSSCVDVKIHVKKFLNLIPMTTVVYSEESGLEICKNEFHMRSDYHHKCFKWTMIGILHGFCKTLQNNKFK